MKTIRPALIASAFALAGCATSEPIYLQNMTGDTATCGPSYSHLGFFNERGQETDAELRERCIADLERRGFHRVAAPAQQGAPPPRQ
jgi:hypothetical protein